MNTMIQNKILPRLNQIESEVKSVNDRSIEIFNNFTGYDIESLELSDTVYHKLDFVTKFVELNKKSFRELIFRNIKITRDVYSNVNEALLGVNLRLRVINL